MVRIISASYPPIEGDSALLSTALGITAKLVLALSYRVHLGYAQRAKGTSSRGLKCDGCMEDRRKRAVVDVGWYVHDLYSCTSTM